MNVSNAFFSRRKFLTHASYFGGLYAMASQFPFPAVARSLSDDPRIAQTPIADAGFASVRKIGDGLYSTISDPSKGMQTRSNGGFLVGKDAALLLEGYQTPAGAKFQWDTFRSVSQIPVMGALDTHYHFDHSMGNSFYGANGVDVWAHANVADRMIHEYGSMQSMDKAALFAPMEKRVSDAKSELQKKHAQDDLGFFKGVYQAATSAIIAIPNKPINPANFPVHLDLGQMPIILEAFPGHSGTDVIVRVPEHKVVYTGDLLFNGIFPVCFDSQATVSGWRATLKTFAGYDKDTIFSPGHGAICGQDGIQRMRDEFDDISEYSEKKYKAGVPVQDAVDNYMIPDKFKAVYVMAWDFTIGSVISNLYTEWGGKFS
jgi:glyoxylase-like metal-dependent hydrolase (beta-lactamase superfamily II)